VAAPLLRNAALVLFFGYAATLVLAGAEGAVAAQFAFPDDAEADLASTYRFLRALELCFGVVAIAYWRRIFAERMPNLIFLSAMAAGVAGRLLGLAVDGWPGLLILGVIVWGLAGVVVIFLATRAVR
jgi:Domain of unknown function (DUF4345)